jgi:hypothetical protein
MMCFGEQEQQVGRETTFHSMRQRDGVTRRGSRVKCMQQASGGERMRPKRETVVVVQCLIVI